MTVLFFVCILDHNHWLSHRGHLGHVSPLGAYSLTNKKSELMLMRRARAYSSSCSQVTLVYLRPFHRNSLFCSQKSPKNH